MTRTRTLAQIGSDILDRHLEDFTYGEVSDLSDPPHQHRDGLLDRGLTLPAKAVAYTARLRGALPISEIDAVKGWYASQFNRRRADPIPQCALVLNKGKNGEAAIFTYITFRFEINDRTKAEFVIREIHHVSESDAQLDRTPRAARRLARREDAKVLTAQAG